MIYAISLSPNSFDADCLHGAFERNPRVDAARGTDCLTTRHILYVTNSTPVHFLINFVGGVGNSATVSDAFTYLRYTCIAEISLCCSMHESLNNDHSETT